MTKEEEAAGMEVIAEGFRHYARLLRGEEQDLTGRGAWAILLDKIERVTGHRVITAEQYGEFKRLSEEDFKRRGGRTSY